MGAQNVGLTAANTNRNIYTVLMFYETEFPMTCRKRERTFHYTGTSLQETQIA